MRLFGGVKLSTADIWAPFLVGGSPWVGSFFQALPDLPATAFADLHARK
jgi:hypothetical protein